MYTLHALRGLSLGHQAKGFILLLLGPAAKSHRLDAFDDF